jgi:hypothetical protein
MSVSSENNTLAPIAGIKRGYLRMNGRCTYIAFGVDSSNDPLYHGASSRRCDTLTTRPLSTKIT